MSPRQRIIKRGGWRGDGRGDGRGAGEEKQKSLWGPVDCECNCVLPVVGFKRLDLEDVLWCDVAAPPLSFLFVIFMSLGFYFSHHFWHSRESTEAKG